MEIKKRFKIKALEYHPDKNMAAEDLTPEQKKELEEKFKMLGEGLEILCDPQKRKLYDEGYDKAAIEERVAAANRAAHNPQHGQGYHNHRR
jgi:curved DNA-binding protein CbpA